MLPSIACTQLQSVKSLLACQRSGGSSSVPKSRNGVMVSRGPM
jgi:hypothetical protein